MSKKIFVIFILLFSYIKEIINVNLCDSASPENRNDCFIYSSPESYCCYKLDSSLNKNCELIKKEDLSTRYDLDCGVSEENYGKYEFGQYHPKQNINLEGFTGCGEYNPQGKSDCVEYSELSNSCCLFQSTDGKKACFYIGKKYDRKDKELKFEDYTIKCKSFNLILSLSSILLLIFLL